MGTSMSLRNRSACLLQVAVCVGVVLAGRAAAAGDPAEWIQYLPADTNTLAIVRVNSVLSSERSAQAGWRAKLEERFLSGGGGFSPHIEALVVGSLTHPGVPEEVWSTALFSTPLELSMETIATHEQAPIADLAGRRAVRARDGAYVIELTPTLFGAYRPGHRQDAARWMDNINQQRGLGVSRYLVSVANRPQPIVLAIDLRHAVDAQRVRQQLEQDERFRSYAEFVDALVPLLTGLQGVCFTADISDRIAGRVQIDFDRDVGRLKFAVRALFVSILEDLGASIDELADFSVATEGTSLVLEGTLGDESLRRMMSLVIAPSLPEVPSLTERLALTPATPAKPAATDPLAATRKYVSAVNKYISDLEAASRRAKEYERTATWHDNYAQKILALPVQDVAQEAIDYGLNTASSFRALAASLRGQAVSIQSDQNALVYRYNYQPGAVGVNIWGGVGYRESAVNYDSNLQEVRERQAAAVQSGSNERLQIWQSIHTSRDSMTARLSAAPAGR